MTSDVRQRERMAGARAWKDQGDKAFRNVLVPVDESREAEQALSLALRTAGTGGTVRLVEVVSSDSGGTPHDLPPVIAANDRRPPEYVLKGGHLTADVERASGYLNSLAHAVREAGAQAAWEVRQGSPYKQVLSAARDCGADAVVMSQHARHPLWRLIHPDLVKYLADRLGKPVLVCVLPRSG